jgi:hypothetical protein
MSSGAAADEVRAPLWLDKEDKLPRQPTGDAGITSTSWQRGHWLALSLLAGPVA